MSDICGSAHRDRTKVSKSISQFVKLWGRVLIGVKTNGNGFFEVLVNGWDRSSSISVEYLLPNFRGKVERFNKCLNRWSQAKGNVALSHVIRTVPLFYHFRYRAQSKRKSACSMAPKVSRLATFVLT